MIKLKNLLNEKTKADLNESAIAEIISGLLIPIFGVVFKIVWPNVVDYFEHRKKNKQFRNSPQAKWLSNLDKNVNFKKYVYHTIKNDNTLKDFAEKIKNKKKGNTMAATKMVFDKWKYQGELVKRWLNSKPAQDELDKAIKEMFPDKTGTDKYTYKQREYSLEGFKKIITREAAVEFTEALNEGTTIKYLNKFAKQQGLEPLA